MTTERIRSDVTATWGEALVEIKKAIEEGRMQSIAWLETTDKGLHYAHMGYPDTREKLTDYLNEIANPPPAVTVN